MHKKVLVLFLLLAVVPWPSLGQEKELPVKVFILGGQSNMDGYGFTEDLSVFTFEGQKIKETINGIEETWIMPKKKGDRCIVYAEIENIKDGLYINGRP